MDEKDTQSTGVLQGTLAWFRQPFNSDGSAFNWVLFVGLLVIAAFFWNVILIDLIER